MDYILSAQQMTSLDHRTIRENGTPACILMENAGKACANYLMEEYGMHLKATVAVFCGNGNNGGDGYVIARILSQHSIPVVIYRIKDADQSPETKANMDACLEQGIPIQLINSSDELFYLEQKTTQFSMLIDAVFGIGFRGKPGSLYQKLFTMLNSMNSFRVAIDIPSGLEANTGNAVAAFKADCTIAIEAYKYGHFIGQGRALCGAVSLVKIGVPDRYYDDIDPGILISNKNCRFPERNLYSNKSDYGKAFVIAGSTGFSGAALLASKAALRSGAGYVHLLYRPEMKGIYDAVIPEVLCQEIPALEQTGNADISSLSIQLQKASAVLIGPGFGTDAFASNVLFYCLSHLSQPLVIDADGISIIAANPELLKLIGKPNILLTPHIGEFLRLANLSKEVFNADPLAHLRAFVSKFNSKVLLKNYSTIYMDNSNTYVCISGNDGLSTGGSGDVLGGIICSFAAQNLPLPYAAINASYLLGKTAEDVALIRETPSIIPSDIIDHLFMKA